MKKDERRETTDEIERNGAPFWFTLFLNNHFEHLVRRLDAMEQRIWMLMIAVVGSLVSLIIAVALRGGV